MFIQFYNIESKTVLSPSANHQITYCVCKKLDVYMLATKTIPRAYLYKHLIQCLSQHRVTRTAVST